MSIFSSSRDNRDTAAPQGNAQAASANPATASAPRPATAPASSSSVALTSISEGTVLDGQIKIEGDIRIEGLVKGTVTSKGKVMIGGSGKVDGDIICQSAEIAGHVGGKLKVADILFLRGNAVVDGDINTGKLVIENGVKFNGNCTMGAAAPTPVTPPRPVANAVDPNAK